MVNSRPHAVRAIVSLAACLAALLTGCSASVTAGHPSSAGVLPSRLLAVRDHTLITLAPDGTGARTVRLPKLDGDATYEIQHASWSPDETRIAFDRTYNTMAVDYSDAYVANSDGTGVRRLTAHGGDVGEPAWSPDGSRLAVVLDRADGHVGPIGVMSSDGAGLVQVSDGAADEWPTWSPDGRQIAFVRDGQGILAVRADGSGLRRLTEDDPRPLFGLSWSPDGSQIVAAQDLDGAGKTDLVEVATDGSGTQRELTHGPWDLHPVWSPDGTRIAFISGDRRALTVLDVHSGARTELGGEQVTSVAWQGGRANVAGSSTASSSAATPAAPLLTVGSARALADQALARIRDGVGVGVAVCGGPLPAWTIRDYTIGQVTAATPGTFDVSAQVTLRDGTVQTVTITIGTDTTRTPCVRAATPVAGPPSPAPAPADVPSVPSRTDPVPIGAPLPRPPADGRTLPYTSSTIPTDPAQLVEWQPARLDAVQTAAVAAVIRFMVQINRQDFPAALQSSTYRLRAASAAALDGYRTSRFYQVAFGEPVAASATLTVVPGRFVSRQRQAGSPGCTYWPQYQFVVAHVHGLWLVDNAGTFDASPALDAYKRRGSDGSRYLNPFGQRVTC